LLTFWRFLDDDDRDKLSSLMGQTPAVTFEVKALEVYLRIVRDGIPDACLTSTFSVPMLCQSVREMRQ